MKGLARGRAYEDLNKQTPRVFAAEQAYEDTLACSYDTSSPVASCDFTDFGSLYADIPTTTFTTGSFAVNQTNGNSYLQFQNSALMGGAVSVTSFEGKNNVLKILQGFDLSAGYGDLLNPVRFDVNFSTILKDDNDDFIPFNTVAYPDYAHVISVEWFFDLNPEDNPNNSGTYSYPRTQSVFATGGNIFHTLQRQTHTTELDNSVGKWNRIRLVLCDQYINNDPTSGRQLDGTGSGSTSPARSYILPSSVQFDDTVTFPDTFGPTAMYISQYSHYVYPRIS